MGGRRRAYWQRRLVMALVLLSLLASPAAHADEKRMTIWGTPPREKPHFTKAGEGFPPLPLPVVPQRRSEKKRPPAPPKLIANLTNFGFRGWQGSPGAVDQLLNNAKRDLQMWYGWEQLDIAQVVRTHAAGATYRTPILYLCAYYPLDFTEEQRLALAEYVINGGTLLINCCGQKKAYESAKAEMARMFPKYQLRRLPPDHPVYGAYFKIDKLSYLLPGESALDAGASEVDHPRLQAVTLGARAAVLVSYEDMACGWNGWNNPAVVRIAPADSTKLGLNIMTYAAAEMRLAKFQSQTQEVTGPNVRPRQQLVISQLVHGGNWNPNPSAVPLFMKELAANSSVAVQFETATVELNDPAVFNQPLMLMSGQWDPNLSREEKAVLHRYLTTGGVLLAESASGRQEFDAAFRALCKDLFPEAPLRELPPDHPVFAALHKLDAVQLHHEPKPLPPVIEAIEIDGRVVVLYSKFGLSDGWAQQHSAYAKCYATPDAIKLGMNLIVYAMQ